VHVQDRLPEGDQWAQKVREEFADHVREKHPRKQNPATSQTGRGPGFEINS